MTPIPTTDAACLEAIRTRFTPDAAKGLEEIYRSWRDAGRDPATAFRIAMCLLIEAGERETDE